jgi:hypothetical protein
MSLTNPFGASFSAGRLDSDAESQPTESDRSLPCLVAFVASGWVAESCGRGLVNAHQREGPAVLSSWTDD